MADLESYCVLWSRLEDVTSAIGPDWTENGVIAWNPGKFDNGARTINVANYLQINPENFFTPNNFIAEMWFKSEGWNCVNGQSSDGAFHTFFEVFYSAAPSNYVRIQTTNNAVRGLEIDCRIAGIVSTARFTAGLDWVAGDLHHIAFVYEQGAALADRAYIMFDGVKILPVWNGSDDPAIQPATGGDLCSLILCAGINIFEGLHDNIKIYNQSNLIIDAVILNSFTNENEGWPVEAIVPATYTKKQPRVLVLNSEIDLVALGYVTKFGKVTEQKTFDRDKVVTNSTSIPLQNIDDQFNTDNPTSIFANTNWRYQPVKGYDEDDNFILNGVIDDFPDDQTGKKTKMLVKDDLLKLFNTKIEYEGANWETPGDSFKNICDLYGANYNNKYVTDSIAQYELNNCYIWCHFDFDDGATFQQAINKVAQFGAADCYSANNELCFKLWVEFTGGVKFHLVDKDLAKAVKSKLSRIYYNNYIIGYFGDGGIKAKDVDNNYIGEVSVKNNDSKDVILDGSEHQLIEIKDLVSAVFLGEQHIKRTHVNLNTNPFPPLIINFSLPYSHKDFINLQTWFRLTNIAKGWNDKLFEVYINDRDYTGKLLNLTAYEVDESG